MRYKYSLLQAGKKTSLTQQRADKLSAWGFTWDTGIKKPGKIAEKIPWDERYAELVAYKEEHGHVNVPQNSSVLGTWVHGQRRQYTLFKRGSKSSMTPEKIRKLTAIDFVFLTRKSPLEQPTQGNDSKRKPGRSKVAAKMASESESSSEEDDDDERHGDLSYIQQYRNIGNYTRSQMEFAPWDRYKT
jgi:hypothetical protein